LGVLRKKQIQKKILDKGTGKVREAKEGRFAKNRTELNRME
jgi:hypothetical protein